MNTPPDPTPTHAVTVQATALGDVPNYLRVQQEPLTAIAPHQVLVELQASPVNPADLNMLEGRYAIRPEPPFVPGLEGVGVVLKCGVSVAGFKPGQQVIFPWRCGAWAERFLATPEELFPLPPGLPVEQAAMLSINPPTAWRLLHDFASLKSGDWVIQNAANSGVGRALIQIAHRRMLRTVNIVRRVELAEELLALGADVVLVAGQASREAIHEATGGAAIRLALNAVGGEVALRELCGGLAEGGTVVTYGAMSKEAVSLSNAALIFRDLRARGFWITRWYRTASRSEVQKMFAELFPLVKDGTLHSPVEARYPLERAVDAVRHAARTGRKGKILLARISD